MKLKNIKKSMSTHHYNLTQITIIINRVKTKFKKKKNKFLPHPVTTNY